MSRIDHSTVPGTRSAFFSLLFFAALAATPTAADAAEVLPPDNSAVTQYTEAFPTARGDRDAHDGDLGKRSPEHVLGKRNTERLSQEGPVGEAVAALTAETAPGGAAGGEEAGEAGGAASAPRSEAGGTGVEGSGRVQPAGEDDGGKAAVAVPEPDGSSGISQVLRRATGTSDSGGLGIFLPLLIIATLAWAAAYVARQRRPTA